MPHVTLPSKFNLTQLAAVCGVARQTLQKRLDAAGIVGEREGREFLYIPAATIEALYAPGKIDYQEAKRQEAVERANKLRVEREVLEGDRVPIEKVNATLNHLGGTIRAIVRSSKLPDDQKNEIMRSCLEAAEEFTDGAEEDTDEN